MVFKDSRTTVCICSGDPSITLTLSTLNLVKGWIPPPDMEVHGCSFVLCNHPWLCINNWTWNPTPQGPSQRTVSNGMVTFMLGVTRFNYTICRLCHVTFWLWFWCTLPQSVNMTTLATVTTLTATVKPLHDPMNDHLPLEWCRSAKKETECDTVCAPLTLFHSTLSESR